MIVRRDSSIVFKLAFNYRDYPLNLVNLSLWFFVFNKGTHF